eukprot:TRINITY_DN3185_c0_g1_i1.p1 TRINITY_DN3185_c0_g1~~TRINITY_DN3185_c0_g1_i1.p1  ORF type:complete len:341 (+),score=44.17 TRINITY_DN3185_c0_g1_i1:302-1324(+)
MNSFNTHEDTQQVLSKYKNSGVTIRTFNQSRFPRILKDTMVPLPKDVKGSLEDWYPPGHGDFFQSFYNSGLLQELLDQGKEYIFLSNVDNLASTCDFDICKYLEESGSEYFMELTEKTKADVKGGTLIEYEGRVRLLEIAQVPPSRVPEFASIKKFKIFNTNNIWLRMNAIKRTVEDKSIFDLDVIENKKTVNKQVVLQLETAVGAAIKCFKGGKGILVSRDRFLPVKSTNDLFVIQSNIYEIRNGALIVNPRRPFSGAPLIKLGSHFSKVKGYMERLKGIPNLLELDQLTISGDVTLGEGVTLKGSVIIVANDGQKIDIAPGSVLENKIITGSLRILDL